jgi:hypothetical protein
MPILSHLNGVYQMVTKKRCTGTRYTVGWTLAARHSFCTHPLAILQREEEGKHYLHMERRTGNRLVRCAVVPGYTPVSGEIFQVYLSHTRTERSPLR